MTSWLVKACLYKYFRDKKRVAEMHEQVIVGVENETVLLTCVGIWSIGLIVLIYFTRRRKSVGLVLSYASLLTILHFGAVVYLLPWYDPDEDAYLRSQGANTFETSIGLAISTLGLIAFVFGAWLSDFIFRPRVSSERVSTASPLKFGKSLMIVGAVFFFGISPIATLIPSGSSISSSGVYLTIVGICIYVFGALRAGGVAKIQALATSLSLPAVTMLFMGFVGYGISALVEIGCFLFRFIKIKVWSYGIAFAIFWLGLSFYITYMDSRIEIRQKVWGNASITDRVTTVAEKLMNGQIFDPTNNRHLHQIDTRINQNALVGKSFVHIRSKGWVFANGESLVIAAVAWVPRIIWADKPTFGGSGGFATEYTGMSYERYTSVGVGLVMEMFANFGWLGVFLGLFVFGLLMRYFDHSAAVNLASGQLWPFSKYQLIGFSLMQPGGFLAECIASLASSYLLIAFLRWLLSRQSFFTKTRKDEISLQS